MFTQAGKHKRTHMWQSAHSSNHTQVRIHKEGTKTACLNLEAEPPCYTGKNEKVTFVSISCKSCVCVVYVCISELKGETLPIGDVGPHSPMLFVIMFHWNVWCESYMHFPGRSYFQLKVSSITSCYYQGVSVDRDCANVDSDFVFIAATLSYLHKTMSTNKQRKHKTHTVK